MRKALFKKQFLELTSVLFQNRKTGKRRGGIGIFLYVMLFVVLYVTLAGMMLAISASLGDALLTPGFMVSHANDWLYYAVMGMMAIFVGIFGSVFTAYTTMYHSGDNELLLSMPIPPSEILMVRMTILYVMSLIFTSIVWIPTTFNYVMSVWVSVTSLVFPILLMFLIALLVTVLSCIMGWIIAIVVRRTKHKNVLTVVVSLVCFGAYYYVCFRLQTLINQMVANLDTIGTKVKGSIWPLYQLGLAAAGEVPAMICVTLMIVAVFLICWFVLSRTFLAITTASPNQAKTVYRETTSKVNGVKKALLIRELRRFGGSPVYMLNCGLGIAILPVLGILALVKAETIRSTIVMISAEILPLDSFASILVAGMLCMVLSMNAITAPSVSLEGKSLWIVRSLPVPTRDILQAKVRMALLLNGIPGIVAGLMIGIAVELPAVEILLAILLVLIYVWFSADLGLILNLLFPNLTWTNISAPIKQSMAVMIAIFGGSLISLAMIGGGILLTSKMSSAVALILWSVVLATVTGLLQRWIGTRGVRRFERL